MCQGWDYYCQSLGMKAIEMYRGRVEAWKDYPVETSVLGLVGGTLHVSMRMHPFTCESISEARVNYQHNGPADGCSCHTWLSALGDHSRQPCSEGGQGRVMGQGRAPGVCMSGSPDHTGSFQITQHCNNVIRRRVVILIGMERLNQVASRLLLLLNHKSLGLLLGINLCIYTVWSGFVSEFVPKRSQNKLIRHCVFDHSTGKADRLMNKGDL